MDFDTFLERAAEDHRAEAGKHDRGTSDYNEEMALFHDSVARSLAARSSKTSHTDEQTKRKLKVKEDKHRERSGDLERKSR